MQIDFQLAEGRLQQLAYRPLALTEEGSARALRSGRLMETPPPVVLLARRRHNEVEDKEAEDQAAGGGGG